MCNLYLYSNYIKITEKVFHSLRVALNLGCSNMHNLLMQCSRRKPEVTRVPFKIAARTGQTDVQGDQISSGGCLRLVKFSASGQ